MEDNLIIQSQAKGINIPSKARTFQIDCTRTATNPQKQLILKRNLIQRSEYFRSQTPHNIFQNKSNERLNPRFLKSMSNHMMSKSVQLCESVPINGYVDKSGCESPQEIKNFGNSFKNDLIDEQKRYKLLDDSQKQKTLSLKKAEQFHNQPYLITNQDEVCSQNENLHKGLNLTQYLKKKDTQIDQKRIIIKQKLAEINFDDFKKLSQQYQQKLLLSKSSSQKRTIKTTSSQGSRLVLIKPIASQRNSILMHSQRNSILVNGLPMLDPLNILQRNINQHSFTGNIEEQFDQEQKKLLSVKQNDVYFSSIMEANVNTNDNLQSTNFAAIPLRKRIPQITTDQQMNLALGVLINKTKEQRNHEDIAIIMKATKQIPFFHKIESKVLLFQNLCRSMQYQFIPKGRVVFYYGDFPDRFYITLKGKVSILIPKRSEDIAREDMVQKDNKQQPQQQKYTIHRRFLYRSIHRAFKRLVNILYFLLILKVKGNILQKIPKSFTTKSRIDFTLISLPEGEQEDSDTSSVNHPRNHSIVLQTEQTINDKKALKSRVQFNDYIENEIEKAMKGIKRQNSEKKILFKSQMSNTNLQDLSKVRQSNYMMDMNQSQKLHKQSVQFQQVDPRQSINSYANKNSIFENRKISQFDQQDLSSDLSGIGLSKNLSKIVNFKVGLSKHQSIISPIQRGSNSYQQSITERSSIYQPIQPPQSYMDLESPFQNVSQFNFMKKDSQNNQQSITQLISQTSRDNNLLQTEESKGSQKEFRQPLEKYKDMLLEKMLTDETADPTFHSSQLYIQKLDQEMKDMQDSRTPSMINMKQVGQVENLKLAKKLQSASKTAFKRRSFLKIGVDCFVSNSNQNTFKIYQEKKKLIEAQIKGLDLEKLENGAHFFKNNTFKYNHAFTSGDGLVFGELGILNKKPRAATIICLEDCYFGYLSSQNYQQILMKKEKNSLIKKREFIEQTLMSNQLSGEKMSKVSYYFHKRKYQTGEVIYKEGEQPTRVYLVKKGEVELQKEEEVIYDESDLSKVTIRVAKLTSREYFGDCDIFYNRKRKYTAITTMESTIYYCEKGQFMKQLEDMKDFWQKYGEKIQSKEEYRNQKIQDSKRTRNYEKNLRKISSSPKKKKTKQDMTKQQKMDEIICGVNNMSQINQNYEQNDENKSNQDQVQSLQSSPRKQDDTATEKHLMTKSSLYTPRLKNTYSISYNALDSLFNRNNISTKSQRTQNSQSITQTNYNQDRTQNLSQNDQNFYSPSKIYHPQSRSQIGSYGYLTERNYNNSVNKESSSVVLFSSQDLYESNTERKLSKQLNVPLTKKDIKNIYAPIYSAKDLVLEDENNKNTNQINDQQYHDANSNQQSNQIPIRKNNSQIYNNSQLFNHKSVYLTNQNNGCIINKDNEQMNSNRFNIQSEGILTSRQDRSEKIFGQKLNIQLQENDDIDNLKRDQLQDLREYFFPGMETIKRLKQSIKINKQLLKKNSQNQKQISAHDQYRITKEVCTQSNDIYQREEKVIENKLKARQMEYETGIRKQIHHSKKGSEICSIYTKLSSMDDKVTFSNSHQLEPEMIVQSPLFSKNNSTSFKPEINSQISPNTELNSPTYFNNFSSQIQKNITEKDDQTDTQQQTQSMMIVHSLSTDTQQYRIPHPNNKENRMIKDDIQPRQANQNRNDMIKTASYFLYQDKGFAKKSNEIQSRQSQSRTLSNRRNQSLNQNLQLNNTVAQNPNDTDSTTHRISHSSKSNNQIQPFLPIHSEKLFTGSQNTKQTEPQLNSKLQKKLSTKEISEQSKPLSSKNSQSLKNNFQYKLSDYKITKQNFYPKIQTNKQIQSDLTSSQVGQQIQFDDNQVEKVTIKRFDQKKNYLTSNKITILNHTQKPMLLFEK